MTKFAEQNGFFFYTEAEQLKLGRVSPISKSSLTASEVQVEQNEELSSDAILARQGSYLYSNYLSPDHDKIATRNQNPIQKWKADILKEIDLSRKYNGSGLRLASPESRKSPKRKAASCTSLQKKAVAYHKKNSSKVE